jgi:hypothetical protein
MDAILKFFIANHLFLMLVVQLFANGPEGLILLPISIFWLGFELCLFTALINQLLLKNEKKGSIHLWAIVVLTTFFLYEQATRSSFASY